MGGEKNPAQKRWCSTPAGEKKKKNLGSREKPNAAEAQNTRREGGGRGEQPRLRKLRKTGEKRGKKTLLQKRREKKNKSERAAEGTIS